MTSFRICLVGNSQPLIVDLPVQDIAELTEQASCVRFLAGHMAEANEDGVCPGVMIQTNRIQLAIEG